MSVTVTENPATYSFARTLADYDIHHSADDEGVSADLNPRPAPQGTGQNPPDWEDNFRRVPEYRPIDHDIDFEYRNVYSNVIERAFVWNLFTGVQLVAVTNRLWRATGGKLNDTYFRWSIGGEY